MRIYLDNCALGRLTDDQTQQRVREEADAVQRLFRGFEAGAHEWVISSALTDEAEQNQNVERRQDALDLLRLASMTQAITAQVALSAAGFKRCGLSTYDALHLAAALHAGCAALVTTDDRFIRAAARVPDLPDRFVVNPVQVR